MRIKAVEIFSRLVTGWPCQDACCFLVEGCLFLALRFIPEDIHIPLPLSFKSVSILSATHLLLFHMYRPLIDAEHCARHREHTKMNKTQSPTSKSSQPIGKTNTVLTNHSKMGDVLLQRRQEEQVSPGISLMPVNMC